VKDVRREGSFYRLQFIRAGERCTANARCIVGADGALSLVGRKLFAGGTEQKFYAAMQEWFPAQAAPPYFSVFFDPRITDFYGWTIPKGETLILGAALAPGRSAAVAFGELKQRLAAYGYRLNECLKREGAFIARPRCVPRFPAAGGGAALAMLAGKPLPGVEALDDAERP